MVVAVPTWKSVTEIEKPKTQCLSFSPKGTYLCSWETFYGIILLYIYYYRVLKHFLLLLISSTVNQENPKGSPNLFIWKTETGELIHSYVHKKQMNW